MAEQEILGEQRLAVAHGRAHETEEKKQVLEHRLNSMPLNACSRRPGRLLRPDRSGAELASPTVMRDGHWLG